MLTVETAARPTFRMRSAARCAIGGALLLARLKPGRLQRALEFLRGRARPAEHATALRARDAVVAVSVRCAGPWCLQRSLAVALMCRAQGVWPDWCTGVRMEPFQAHAWVEAQGRPVGENAEVIRLFHPVLRVPAAVDRR
jgi:hypothetical protein